MKLQKVGNDLAQRILSEDAVQSMLHTEKGQRNRVILRLFYGGGLRVSELVSLKWRDLQERDDGGPHDPLPHRDHQLDLTLLSPVLFIMAVVMPLNLLTPHSFSNSPAFTACSTPDHMASPQAPCWH